MTNKLREPEPNRDQVFFDSLLKLAESSEEVGGNIPADFLRKGIGSNDLETNGLIFQMLHTANIYRRVTPPLTLDDFQSLHIKYLPRCMKERGNSEWRQSPYLAAQSLVQWFRHLWADRQQNASYLTDWREALGQLYREGDNDVRDCVVCGVLEHLFGGEPIRDFFDSWKDDPVLRDAYNDAASIVS